MHACNYKINISLKFNKCSINDAQDLLEISLNGNNYKD